MKVISTSPQSFAKETHPSQPHRGRFPRQYSQKIEKLNLAESFASESWFNKIKEVEHYRVSYMQNEKYLTYSGKYII